MPDQPIRKIKIVTDGPFVHLRLVYYVFYAPVLYKIHNYWSLDFNNIGTGKYTV